jgi:hypothetical protein
MKRQFASISNMHTVTGIISPDYNSAPSYGFSKGYGEQSELTNFMRKISNSKKYDKLRWGYLSREDFVLGPMGSGIIDDSITLESQRIIATASLTIDQNFECMESGNKNTERDSNWVIYRCKYCYTWMYSYSQSDELFAVLLNNQIKFPRAGILSTDEWKKGLWNINK